MMRLLLLLLFWPSLSLAGQGMYPVPMVYQGTSAPVCSGDWSTGSNEAFESTDDNTCTTDWQAEGDTSNILSASSTNNFHTGSQSLEVAMTAINQRSYKTADLGATDGTFSVRFYLYTPTNMATLGSTHMEAMEAAVSGPNSSDRLWVRIASTGVYASSQTTSSTITMAAGAWYRIEVDYIASSTSCTIEVWNSSEVSVGSSTFTCRSDALRYFSFGQNNSTTSDYATYYIDDVKFNSSGGLIGAE